MALVSHFSLDQIDVIRLYNMSHCLLDLWTQQTPEIVGAFGHWYHLVSLALSLTHTMYQVMPLSSLEKNRVIFVGCDLQKVVTQM